MQARREGHHVAVFVDDGDIACIAFVVRLSQVIDAERATQRIDTHELLGISRTQLVRCPVRVDELAALLRILLGEQAVVWNGDEVCVTEILFTVGEAELKRLGTRVNVLGTVVAYGLEVIALEYSQHE